MNGNALLNSPGQESVKFQRLAGAFCICFFIINFKRSLRYNIIYVYGVQNVCLNYKHKYNYCMKATTFTCV